MFLKNQTRAEREGSGYWQLVPVPDPEQISASSLFHKFGPIHIPLKL
jgi:hypothetical protein